MICIMKNTTCLQPEKIRAAIDAVFDPASHSIAEFLINGGSNNLPPATPTATPPGISSYSLDWDIIRDMFDPKHYVNGEINHTLVMQRLALIDLFYSANLNRFSQLGIKQLADVIMTLSTNSNGQAYDRILATTAQGYVKNPIGHPLNNSLFNKGYGFPKTHSVSIISKYLFFLLEAHGCPTGFPIYDSIVKKLLPRIAKKIGVTKTVNGTAINGKNLKVIDKYVDCINSVANTIGIQPQKHNNVQLSQFAVLDYFLWRIGKVGALSFSLLLTEGELGNPAIQQALSNIKDKGAQHIVQLPYRFQLWWHIYHFIK